MILARPSNTARARMFTRASPSDRATWARVPGLLASWTVNCLARGMTSPPEQSSGQPEKRIEVAIDDALLERNDAVVLDLDVLPAHPGAASRDVAKTGSELLANGRDPVQRVERVHLERRQADHEARPHERVLARLVPQNVADVLAQIALDALAELLHAVDVPLLHPVRAAGGDGGRPERRGAPLFLVVSPHRPGHGPFDPGGLHPLPRWRL